MKTPWSPVTKVSAKKTTSSKTPYNYGGKAQLSGSRFSLAVFIILLTASRAVSDT